MPEHETFDLDAAFARLERDVAGLSRGRGAADAVSTARRRRRTTSAAIAAVAILVVGGAVAGHSLGHDHAVGPADRVPAPAPLTAEALTSATEGWTPAWVKNSAAAVRKMQETFGGDCFPAISGGQADGITVFGNSHDDLAVTTTSDFSGDLTGEPVVWRRIMSSMQGCRGAREVSSFAGPSGVAGHTYQVRAADSDSAPEYVWIVSTGQGIGVLKVLGQSDPLPAAHDTAVADALVADVEDRLAHSDPQTNGSVQRINPSETLGQVWAEPLVPALEGWSTPWISRLPKSGPTTARALPGCAQRLDWYRNGGGYSVGTDGFEWVNWFPTEPRAVQAVDELRHALATCSTPYDVHTVTLPSGRPVVVASGPRAIWFTRVASHVVVLQLPAGDAPPPDDVSLKVGALIEHVLQQPATTTVRPDGTPVPRWMQRAIAAAPTFGP
jgi:hypothetical protein